MAKKTKINGPQLYWIRELKWTIYDHANKAAVCHTPFGKISIIYYRRMPTPIFVVDAEWEMENPNSDPKEYKSLGVAMKAAATFYLKMLRKALTPVTYPTGPITYVQGRHACASPLT